ncbi:hypothetical protein E6C27_scaffold133G00720 [Cucumis melo var. makuwa]|uniref:Uncharacterized protein n=1 Tax=Cucumis melo var. makuwa TaxID=1194695 RepID=A0A5A7TXB5_CUCMM|nr:hypothetical protein E6C27_scaffold133G00720 [Cucumis melo var. makuwa]
MKGYEDNPVLHFEMMMLPLPILMASMKFHFPHPHVQYQLPLPVHACEDNLDAFAMDTSGPSTCVKPKVEASRDLLNSRLDNIEFKFDHMQSSFTVELLTIKKDTNDENNHEEGGVEDKAIPRTPTKDLVDPTIDPSVDPIEDVEVLTLVPMECSPVEDVVSVLPILPSDEH